MFSSYMLTTILERHFDSTSICCAPVLDKMQVSKPRITVGACIILDKL